jgi:hypothetical protein
MTIFGLTVFTNAGNAPLSKTIRLDPDGKVIKVAAAQMVSGLADRWRGTMSDLAELIHNMPPWQAIARGVIRDGLPNQVPVVTKAKLNGQVNTIARQASDVQFRPNEPAVVLIDFDSHGITDSIRAKVTELGGIWPSLCSVFPDLSEAIHITRPSTSAGLCNGTGAIQGSDGVHYFPLIADGTDNERFLKALHQRCILAGLGWGVVHRGGAFAMRSIVDSVVYTPHGLVFEGAPRVELPLTQDKEVRRPRLYNEESAPLNTKALESLSKDEEKELERITNAERERLGSEIEAARQAYANETAPKIKEQNPGLSDEEARTIALKVTYGHLSPATVLIFDNQKLGTPTLATVLRDPVKYLKQGMADPLEGVAYGRGKAILYQRTKTDGSYFIKSFAHGGRIFELEGQKNVVDDFDNLDLTDPDIALAAMNERYAYVILGDATAVYEKYYDPDEKCWCIRFIRKSTLFDPLAGRLVRLEVEKDGEVKVVWKQLGPWWWKHRRRRSFRRVEFRPIGPKDNYQSPPGVLNLWQGLAVEPREGNCELIKAHLLNIVCGGDEVLCHFITAFYADMFQRPNKKPQSCLALLGDPGSGRSTIGDLIGEMMPAHYFIADDPNLITGRFNGHQSRVIHMQCEEAFWAGNKRDEGKLKQLVTGKSQPIEFKGKDVIRVKSYLRLTTISNENWAAPVSLKDRPWCRQSQFNVRHS